MKKWLSSPYIIWSVLFIVFPLFLVVYFSFTGGDTGTHFTLNNYKVLAQPLYVKVFMRSINLALVSTVVCLIVGYPMAMILADKEINKTGLAVLLFVVPMWMNFLLRTYSWIAILGKNGFINTVLESLGMPKLNLLYNSGAVVLGMVYNFLPFMVLPIYTVLSKMDKSIIEAASDLGANKVTIFRKIIFPLSLPGVMSGITMVFMPAVSTFVISRLLGGGQYTLLGNLVEQQFLVTGDWHFGSSISIVMMILILISMLIMTKYDGEQTGGGGLW
ncbi:MULTISPECIES: ABC transporter permease [Clostridium]|uniref:ABC-type spermidine/putrescine transport system, permease protein 1 n=1 Tax=Clostridium novyi (strain NT) TaxID=386415 RepID=A0PY58_CLONN|nr:MULTISPECIES: ABC transporter permease [Clostridium]ABK61920.1 ABC-type spermidine/putrescine transport system, permease protein 1 [Clostridium novyi NT]KEH87884.1 ABC transporter permease [Clostridium novyi A str. NCTC 538]KEH90111.1 ABC transporter permease [Clostridium novyi A str. 4540]KEH91259.1 ABC transporter permease [Clostridium novyi A str. BKT29909]KEH94662.1 ABC transporter permease [Clostridium botulinum C/D str. It1]